MMNSNCKCIHHKIAMLMGLLTWISAILFLWTAWKGALVFGFGAAAYFDHVIVFALLGFGLMSGMCKCCGQGWKGVKGGECKDGKCDMQHDSNHQHM